MDILVELSRLFYTYALISFGIAFGATCGIACAITVFNLFDDKVYI